MPCPCSPSTLPLSQARARTARSTAGGLDQRAGAGPSLLGAGPRPLVACSWRRWQACGGPTQYTGAPAAAHLTKRKHGHSFGMSLLYMILVKFNMNEKKTNVNMNEKKMNRNSEPYSFSFGRLTLQQRHTAAAPAAALRTTTLWPLSPRAVGAKGGRELLLGCCSLRRGTSCVQERGRAAGTRPKPPHAGRPFPSQGSQPSGGAKGVGQRGTHESWCFSWGLCVGRHHVLMVCPS